MLHFIYACIGFALYFGPISFAALMLLRFCFWLEHHARTSRS